MSASETTTTKAFHPKLPPHVCLVIFTSQRCWLRCPTTRTQRWTPRTTPHGARRQSPAPGWDLPSATNFPRTMAGPPGVSGQRHCWSPGRRSRCSGTQASGTSWSGLSMLLCCRWWGSCRMFTISSPRVCRLLPSRLSTCPRSSSRISPRDAHVVSRSWRISWWKCRRS